MNTTTFSAFHDSEVEKIVLGSMLVESSIIAPVSRVLGTGTAAFYTNDHKLLYSAILTSYERNGTTDPLLVADQLKKEENLNRIGGTDYLYELLAPIVETANIEYYVNILHDKSVRRLLSEASAQVKERALDTELPLKDVMNSVQQLIFEITNPDPHRGFLPILPILAETIDDIEKRSQQDGGLVGVATGFMDFDALTSGLHPGQLVIIAARPSKGKTTLVLNMAQHVALHQPKPVAFFSLEMSGQELTMRMLSAESRIDFSKIRDGTFSNDEWQNLMEASARLTGARMLVNDDMQGTMQDILAETRRLKDEQGGLSLVVIDYLQLMRGSGNRYSIREQEIADISRGLKAMAAELKVPIIACSQLNRDVEKRFTKEPQLSDLRESGAIEQDADLVAFLHEEEPAEGEHTYDSREVELIIKKHRNGPIGRIVLYFTKKQLRFDNPRSYNNGQEG